MSGETARIDWDGAQFSLSRDAGKMWHLVWTRRGTKHCTKGADAAVLLGNAIEAAGFSDETKWEIIGRLMQKLRESLFN